ncbi:MAG: hypothetical protein ACP5N7_02420 [Candidatus Pacearchaeota archaeon]
MTFADIKKQITDTILDFLSIVTDEQFIDYFSYDGVNLFEEHNLWDQNVLIIPLKEIGKSYEVELVLKKLKFENIISDYTDRYGKSEWFEVVLTEYQAKNFGKPLHPQFNQLNGELTYLDKMAKFGIGTRQYKFLELLNSEKSKIFSYEEIVLSLDGRQSHKTDVRNINILVRDISKKLKDKGINYQLFKSSNGYGLNL